MTIRASLCLAALAVTVLVGCSTDATTPFGVEERDGREVEGQRQQIGFCEARVGFEGATLSIPGAVLTIPGGALAAPVLITMERRADGSVELLPHGLLFARSVELHFIVPFGQPAGSHTIEWFDPGAGCWKAIPSRVNGLGRVAPLEHFSLYRIMSHI